MTIDPTGAPVRAAVHGLLLTAVAALLLFLMPGRAVAADSGVVEVYGYQWSQVYDVNLNQLQGSQTTIDGESVTVYNLLEILEDAEGKQNPAGKDFTVATLANIEINFAGGSGKVVYTGAQIRGNASKLAVFYVNDQGVTVLRVPGKNNSVAEYEYSTLNPQLYEPKKTVKQFNLAVSPMRMTIKSGSKVTFKAIPGGLPAGASVSYEWTINGANHSGNNANFSATFTGDSGETFVVTAKATVNGYSPAYAGSQITIDKVKKKPKKDKDKKKDKNESPPGDTGNYDSGYVPGYSDGYYDGGSSGGSGSPSTGSPSPAQPDKEKEPVQPREDPGQTVTGQLIDPSQIATVVPPADTPSTGTEETAPADESSGGGGLSDGAKAALGIGALLGLGGLAEAGAFTGAFRRFRFRL